MHKELCLTEAISRFLFDSPTCLVECFGEKSLNTSLVEFRVFAWHFPILTTPESPLDDNPLNI
jgi:hypothetical protein